MDISNVRSTGELRLLVAGIEGGDANERAILAHIRGAPAEAGVNFRTGTPLAARLFVLAYEYDKATVLEQTRTTPLRTYGNRCRCGKCGMFVAHEGGPCGKCGANDRRLCNDCYDGYLDYRSMQMGYL